MLVYFSLIVDYFGIVIV